MKITIRMETREVLLALLILGVTSSIGDAYTFNGCTAFLFKAMDPIVSPGKPSAHLHTFFGSDSLTETTTESSSLFSGCTSCQNSLDKSTYWTPTLFAVLPNGTYSPLTPLFRAYYDAIDENTVPFPENFRAIAGNSTAVNAFDERAQTAGVNWYCASSPSTRPGETKLNTEFPTVNCSQYLAINIFFPTCYKIVNGKFVTAYKFYKCPTGYLRVPQLWLSMRYDVGDLAWGEDGTAPLWLASGDSYTFHADFFSGWKDSLSTDMVNHEDAAGEFHVGGSASIPNVPACTVKDPYVPATSNYAQFITGNQKWGKKDAV